MQEEDVNPYAPPKSSLVVHADQSATPFFFSTSTFKLTVMSICTLGLYELYWFYKNWVLIKERTGQNIMPFWRAFFAPLWAYSCFKGIKSAANENSVPESLPVGLLAIVYFAIQTTWRLPAPYSLASTFSFLLLIPANTVALRVNEKLISGFANNEKLSGWNLVGVVLGGMLFIFAVIGTFMPEA